jgi:tetratricopeptide (TPR) repeat protein
MKWLSPLCLFLACSLFGFAQAGQTPNGWPYEVLQNGSGPYLQAQQGALTHNRLINASGETIVSTYALGIPDYQLMADLSPAFQQAFSIMQAGGKYRFKIPVNDFKAAVKSGSKLPLSGASVVWEMELIEILPPLPDGAQEISKALKSQGVESAFQTYLTLFKTQKAYFGEWENNQVGYLFLNRGELEKAIQVFIANTNRYPNSYNAHDSLGEAYYKAGELDKARVHYQQSLAINPQNENARQMLQKL